MCIHLTDTEETCNRECKSWCWQLSLELLLLLLHSRSVFQAATAETVLKTQLMLQGKSLYSRHTQRCLDPSSWEQSRGWWWFPSSKRCWNLVARETNHLWGIFHSFSWQRWFHFTSARGSWDDLSVSASQVNKSSSAAHFISRVCATTHPFCRAGAKPHSQPCYSKSLTGPDLPPPSFHAGRVTGCLPGQAGGCKSPKPSSVCPARLDRNVWLEIISPCSTPEPSRVYLMCRPGTSTQGEKKKITGNLSEH